MMIISQDGSVLVESTGMRMYAVKKETGWEVRVDAGYVGENCDDYYYLMGTYKKKETAQAAMQAVANAYAAHKYGTSMQMQMDDGREDVKA